MYENTFKRHMKPRRKRWPWIVAALLLVIIASMVVVRQYYFANLRPVASEARPQTFVVERGAAAAQIGQQLKEDGLIRNNQIFEWYINSKQLRTSLQAGTYTLSADMSLPEIVSRLTDGQVETDNITIVPGQGIDQVKTAFIKAGFAEAAVEAAFNPANYPDAPALADKPATASLEGFLYPETFQKDEATEPADIIRQSLDLMAKQLTPEVRAAFAREGLSVYQGVTVASMVELEVSNAPDRAQAAQVFLRRLREGINLGSDVTALYGARMSGERPSVTYESPYNTATNKGLPPGPVSNVSASALQAVAFPAPTDWVYFVSGDDGTTHFSKTLEEHEALTDKYCTKLCSGAE